MKKRNLLASLNLLEMNSCLTKPERARWGQQASCVRTPLQGFTLLPTESQGVALGWYGVGPLGRMKAK